jgi:4-amino-4-deoxy-L-arabinose transferase-like glycosyltransferase
MAGLKPDSELIVAGLAATVVYSIFAMEPPITDIRADQPSMNTYSGTNSATWTASAVVAGLALLTKSPTVLVVGGGMVLLETWRRHFANFGTSAAKQASQAQ